MRRLFRLLLRTAFFGLLALWLAYTAAFYKFNDATLGDFATYLSINGFTTLDDRGPRYSYLSITPGLRFHLANNYYFIAGIEVPLTGPKDQSFTYSPIFWFAKVW